MPSRVSSLPSSPAPSLSISTSLESGSSHSLGSSDVSLPSVSSTPPPPVPSRVKPPALLPEVLPSDSPSQPAPAKKSPAPPPPQPTPHSEPAVEEQPESDWPVAPPSVAESPPGSPPGSPTTSEPVPKTIGAELIELVRKNTGLSYELSRVAVGVMVGHLETALPQVSSTMEQVLVSLVESKVRFIFITSCGFLMQESA